jgi:hypothetical protein
MLEMDWSLIGFGILALVVGPLMIIFHKRIGRCFFDSEQRNNAMQPLVPDWGRFGSEGIASSTFLAGGIIASFFGIFLIVLAIT